MFNLNFMQLQEFVNKTINEIAAGLQESHKNLEKSGSKVDDTCQITIDFDIAVLSEDQTSENTGAGLTVASVFSAGQKIENENRTQITNRVKFSVCVGIKTANANWGAV
jgi:hypothetical protein